MSEDVHIEDPIEIFCDNCSCECTITPGEDCSITDVKHCPFCGAELDQELQFNDESYEEGWDDE